MLNPPAKSVPAHASVVPADGARLRDAALAAARNAHAPYSSFRVGAAVLLAPDPAANIPSGTIVVGCNVENASFRLTTCAEQSAIAAAVAHYGPTIRLLAVVVVNLNDAASAPCGACRQTIAEFSTPTTRIFFPASDGSVTEASIADLLPAAFQADSFLPNP